MHWCNKCRKRHDNYKELKREKNKKGRYYPYRDTMDAEHYTYTEVVLECLECGDNITTEEDEKYSMSKSDMQKYGYKGANYGS